MADGGSCRTVRSSADPRFDAGKESKPPSAVELYLTDDGSDVVPTANFPLVWELPAVAV